jgi:hypothetical protein
MGFFFIIAIAKPTMRISRDSNVGPSGGIGPSNGDLEDPKAKIHPFKVMPPIMLTDMFTNGRKKQKIANPKEVRSAALVFIIL